ncbi:MAG: cell wall-binding protein, partial [SAR324 cluster bacterium]|nr:cell wall-binding protein [SAR324 cluster bacterium]
KRNSGTKKDLRGITYGNGKFVMVGNVGTILTSPDSNTWTKRESGTSQHLRRVFFELMEQRE